MKLNRDGNYLSRVCSRRASLGTDGPLIFYPRPSKWIVELKKSSIADCSAIIDFRGVRGEKGVKG